MSNSPEELRVFRDSDGAEWVEVLVEEESVAPTPKTFPKDNPSGPREENPEVENPEVGGEPQAKEVAAYRSAPRVETNYPSEEFRLDRKSQPGYRVLPAPKNQPIPRLPKSGLPSPPKRKRVESDSAEGSSRPTFNPIAGPAHKKN